MRKMKHAKVLLLVFIGIQPFFFTYFHSVFAPFTRIATIQDSSFVKQAVEFQLCETLGKSLIEIKNSKVPSTDLCGRLDVNFSNSEFLSLKKHIGYRSER